MSSTGPELDTAFIEKQRQRLLELRESLQSAAKDAQSDEAALNSESSDRPREHEDEAQRLTLLELDGTLAARDLARAGRVDRALKKIEEGTYGFSDLSGEPIPRERLEAVPESIYTAAEQEALERSGLG
ncbi:MAG: TraR/DksA family transcriptional regulator [Gammaproteobacteria bacterium]|nr:TraR/DksA family transcriptional regulator [Gammaproteobacteria bacterium]